MPRESGSFEFFPLHHVSGVERDKSHFVQTFFLTVESS